MFENNRQWVNLKGLSIKWEVAMFIYIRVLRLRHEGTQAAKTGSTTKEC